MEQYAKNCAKQARLRANFACLPWGNVDDYYTKLKLQAIKHKVNGLLFEIDHIVPLSGSISNVQVVCGLHISENLQLITRQQNRRKNGLRWDNMPEYTAKDIEELRPKYKQVVQERSNRIIKETRQRMLKHST